MIDMPLHRRPRARHHLLILDNLESITGSPLSIPNTLDAGERGKLADFLKALKGGRTAVLLVYALGKAQRVLRMLDPSIGTIGVHGALRGINDVYVRHGIDLPAVVHANAESAPGLKGAGVVLAPPSAASGPWIRRFAGPGGLDLALVSGWMRVRGRRRWRSVDRGFVLSDHADWPGLLAAIESTGAERVGLTHGSAATMARYLAETRAFRGRVAPKSIVV